MGLGFLYEWGVFCGLFDDVIGRSNEPISWLKDLLDSRLLYKSSESLIDFLAFLVQKLCQKNSKYFYFLRNVGRGTDLGSAGP